MDIHNGSTKFDINLELDDVPEGIQGRLIYNSDLFEASTIQRMIEDWCVIIAEVVVDPSRRVSDVVAAVRARTRAVPAGKPVYSVETNSPEKQGLVNSVRRMFSSKS